MAIQKEKEGTSKSQLEAAVGKPVTYVSGGMIENFRGGWATDIFGNGSVAHYYKRVNFDTTKSVCLLSTADARWMYGRGNYPQCKRCRKIVEGR